MSQATNLTAIISIDNTEVGVAITDGLTLTEIHTGTSGVSGKSRKGGSSARRYERNRESELNTYYHRAAKLSNTILLPYIERVVRLVVSGPAFTKEEFLKHEYLDYRLRQKPLTLLGIEYSGLEGLYQTRSRLSEMA